MKTIYDHTTRQEIIKRIQRLSENSTAQWGKMNPYQMTRHCTIWNNWMLGTNKPVYKQELLGRIFGKIALKGLLKDERPLKKNMPSGRAFVVKERTGDMELERAVWIKQVNLYADYSNPTFVHDFFGKMTHEEIGFFVYKHFDHHLRQFNV